MRPCFGLVHIATDYILYCHKHSQYYENYEKEYKYLSVLMAEDPVYLVSSPKEKPDSRNSKQQYT